MDYWQRKRAERAAVVGMVAAAIGLAVVFGPSAPTTNDVTADEVADGAAQVRNASPSAEPAVTPMTVTREQMAGSTTHTLDAGGRASFPLDYHDGGFWLVAGREITSERDSVAALTAASEHRAAVWSAGDLAFVSGCCEGSTPRIDVVLRERRPALLRRPGVDGIAEITVDVPRGRLLLGSNGDGGISDVIRVRSGRYRLRVSGHHSTREGSRDERFRFDLWPASAAAPPAVLLPHPA